MDFLTQHRAIIDLKSKSITLSTDEAISSKTALEHHAALSVFDQEISGSPGSSVIVPVCTGNSEDNEGIIEGNTQLLFDRGLGFARGIARFRNGKAQVLVTNFSEEYGHPNKGTTIAFLYELADFRNVVALSDRPAADSPKQDCTPTFDINQALPRKRRDQIQSSSKL